MRKTTVANVSVPNPDTPLQFYRDTRPKTPAYAKWPENAGLMECSKCRFLFLPDTPEARTEHRRWHAENYGVFMMPCRLVDAAGGRYAFVTRCKTCTSDLCLCCECQAQHPTECSQWKAVHIFGELDADELADILWEAIEENRNA